MQWESVGAGRLLDLGDSLGKKTLLRAPARPWVSLDIASPKSLRHLVASWARAIWRVWRVWKRVFQSCGRLSSLGVWVSTLRPHVGLILLPSLPTYKRHIERGPPHTWVNLVLLAHWSALSANASTAVAAALGEARMQQLLRTWPKESGLLTIGISLAPSSGTPSTLVPVSETLSFPDSSDGLRWTVFTTCS